MNLDELIESSRKISGIDKIEKENNNNSKSLPKQNIKTLFITIKTYSDVCKHLGEKEYSISDFAFLSPEYAIKSYNTTRLQQIAKLFNNGWIPNWLDHKEYKWFPYYQNTGMVGGSRWSFHSSYCSYSEANAVVCYYQTEEIANFIGKQFQDIYIEYIESI